MSGAEVPAAAVEAAAKALIWEQSHGCYTYRPEGRSGRDDMDRYADKHARAALEAAAPHMLAAAWDEGRRVGHAHPYKQFTETPYPANPYRPTP